MASKRHLRRKACQGKVRHLTEAHARAAIHSLHTGKGWQGHMNAYRCPFCKGWHVGHAKRQGGLHGTP